jgi:rSAM/selenodomain-associated transferase 1
MRPAVIVFMKAPEAGRCKTRLCPPLSPAQAADLYRAFCADVMSVALAAGTEVVVVYEGSEAFPTPAWAAPALPFLRQAGADLGQRLVHAFDAVSRVGFAPIVAIGTDLPTLPPARIAEAVALLAKTDAVLGPAADGGYYLVGLAAPRPALFRGIPWSTNSVLSATLAAARADGVEVALLPEHRDVDTPDDLRHLAACLERGPRELAPATREALASLGLPWDERHRGSARGRVADVGTNPR